MQFAPVVGAPVVIFTFLNAKTAILVTIFACVDSKTLTLEMAIFMTCFTNDRDKTAE